MDSKCYNTFSKELKRVFGFKVHRISVDAGFTCPNRDGSIGTDGCIYCGQRGSGSFGIARGLSIYDQMEDGKEVMTRKYKSKKFMAYFQAYSNTYKSIDLLKAHYNEALSSEDIVGLIVATRPDCISTEVLDLLESYSKKTYFWLELGLQSAFDKTLNLINRGHNLETFIQTVKRCQERGIRISAHVILGLPGESKDEMLASASLINDLDIEGIKIHLLHIMKDTILSKMYDNEEVTVMEKDEYVSLVCDYMELLNPKIFIQRMTGDGGRDYLVAPLWSLKKFEVLNAIDAEFKKRKSFQGKFFNNAKQNTFSL